MHAYTHAHMNIMCIHSLLFIDINECDAKTHQCHKDAYCNNTKGSYNCTCNVGYDGNGTYCEGNVIYFRLWNLCDNLV